MRKIRTELVKKEGKRAQAQFLRSADAVVLTPDEREHVAEQSASANDFVGVHGEMGISVVSFGAAHSSPFP
jgi:hypothetical protein